MVRGYDTNFFRRYKISDDIFGYATYYKKYSIQDDINIETIANNHYGSSYYDWVIVLTNNYINPRFAFPVNSETVRKIADKEEYKMPATIDDPAILDEIKNDLITHKIIK